MMIDSVMLFANFCQKVSNGLTFMLVQYCILYIPLRSDWKANATFSSFAADVSTKSIPLAPISCETI